MQELVSCMSNPNSCGGTGGCSGATAELAFDYLQANGLAELWTYGYLPEGMTLYKLLIVYRNNTQDAQFTGALTPEPMGRASATSRTLKMASLNPQFPASLKAVAMYCYREMIMGS